MKTIAFNKLKNNNCSNKQYNNDESQKKVNRLIQIQNKLVAKISPVVNNKISPFKSNYYSTQQLQQQQSVSYDLSDKISLNDLS